MPSGTKQQKAEQSLKFVWFGEAKSLPRFGFNSLLPSSTESEIFPPARARNLTVLSALRSYHRGPCVCIVCFLMI